MQFQHAISIDASPAVVWSFLWDVERLARCIPGCEHAVVIHPHQRYSALIADKIGPLKLKMPLDLVVESAVEQQHLHVIGTGRDATLGSNVRVDIRTDLSAKEGATVMSLTVDATVSGKIAGLGMGLFKRKFDDIMNRFSVQVKNEIEQSQRTTPAG